jgi:hypothetical protein
MDQHQSAEEYNALQDEIDRGLATVWLGEKLLNRAGEVAQNVEKRVKELLSPGRDPVVRWPEPKSPGPGSHNELSPPPWPF